MQTFVNEALVKVTKNMIKDSLVSKFNAYFCLLGNFFGNTIAIV